MGMTSWTNGTTRLVCATALLWSSACVTNIDPERNERVGTTRRAAVMCADGDVVDGIDVSRWQGNIDWLAVAESEIDFAFIRVSDGLAYPDSKFAYNWEQARSVGILRGSYQFFRNNIDPIEQAQKLLDDMGPLEEGDLPPVIDIETNDGPLPKEDFAQRVHQWLDHVESALHVKPIIYTRASFWNPHIGSTEFGDYPMWVAHYGTDGYVCPNVPGGWGDWTFHQYTSSGNQSPDDAFRDVAGISGRVDLNFFNGSYDQLLALTYQVDDGGGGGEYNVDRPVRDEARGECRGGACIDDWKPGPPEEPQEEPGEPAGCSAVGARGAGVGRFLPLMALITFCRRRRRQRARH